MTFIRLWAGFAFTGLATAVVLLLWAFRSRQFAEPDRTALTPFDDESAPPPRRVGAETVALLGVLGTGLVVLAAAVVVSVVD